uniref:Uncharacterized protein n=1 Tax=Moniliophthora roreri TaxID=221103 RepID=A0A0W0FJS4_MONRR
MEQTEEVYERLCALCADWRNTVPLTAGSIVAHSAPNVHLDIYLVTATTDEDDLAWDDEVYGDGES